jgi:hypothetical protein
MQPLCGFPVYLEPAVVKVELFKQILMFAAFIQFSFDPVRLINTIILFGDLDNTFVGGHKYGA